MFIPEFRVVSYYESGSEFGKQEKLDLRILNIKENVVLQRSVW